MIALIVAISLALIHLLNLSAILVMIFRRREEPIFIIAWTMLMTFIPLVGFILYLLFGHGPIIKEKRTFIDDLEDTHHHFKVEEQMDRFVTLDQEENPFLSLIKFNLNYNKSLLTTNNEIEFFSDAKNKYEKLIEDIMQAKESINILYFIVRDDQSGQALLSALTQKAKEGVKVRFVYDDGGSFMTPWTFFKPLVEAGGVVVKHYPAKFKIFTLNWNYRNHRKIVVIDGTIGYMGGMNIGDEYLSKNPKYSPWRDAHFRVRGEAVAQLQARFFKDYFAVIEKTQDIQDIEKEIELYFKPCHIQHKTHMQIITDGPDQQKDHMRATFIKLIMSARKSIWIQSPYFIPDSEFLHVLKIAAHSGLDVKIMIPVIPDNHFVHRTTTSYVKELLEAGIEVYFYEGFLHSKIIIIDGKMCSVGSVNMDVRSFSINFEITAFIYDEGVAQQLNKQFQFDQQNCRLLDLEYERKKSWFMKAEESVYRLLSMLM